MLLAKLAGMHTSNFHKENSLRDDLSSRAAFCLLPNTMLFLLRTVSLHMDFQKEGIFFFLIVEPLCRNEFFCL